MPKTPPVLLAELNVFPVKALAGFSPPRADVEPRGLQGDRRWMVVDRAGRMLTQRTHPAMATIHAGIHGAHTTLSRPGHGSVTLALPAADAPRAEVSIWRDSLTAALAAEHAHAWITRALGTDARLAYMDEQAVRPVNPTHGAPNDRVSFADGYPLLLTSLSSLADLNARLDHPVPISRFRANLVVAGAAPWAEDTWRVIRIGSATFRVVKPCERCTVTTIDQQTGERPHRTEPLRTLARFRQDERGIMFGQNLIPVEGDGGFGLVTVGDRVEVLESGAPNVVPVVAGSEVLA